MVGIPRLRIMRRPRRNRVVRAATGAGGSSQPTRGADARAEHVGAQRPHLGRRRAAAKLGEPQRLFLDLGARQRVPRIALRLVHAPVQHASVGRLDVDLADPALRVGGLDLGVVHHPHAIAECDHRRIAEVAVELDEPGAMEDRDRGEHRAHRELGLMDRGRIRDRTEHVDRRLVHVRRDPRDVPRREAVCADDLQQRVGRRMRVPAGRVELERCFRQRPALAQPVGETRGVGVGRHAGRHPLRALQDAASRR